MQDKRKGYRHKKKAGKEQYVKKLYYLTKPEEKKNSWTGIKSNDAALLMSSVPISAEGPLTAIITTAATCHLLIPSGIVCFLTVYPIITFKSSKHANHCSVQSKCEIEVMGSLLFLIPWTSSNYYIFLCRQN